MNRAVVVETLRRHFTSPAYVVFLVLLALVAFGVSRFESPAAVWPSLVGVLALVTGAGLIGPEFSSGRLQLILVKPVNRSVYLLSRFAGVGLTIWAAAAVGFAVEGGARALLWDGPSGLPRLATAFLNTGTGALLTCAVLALLGSVTRAYWNIALYMLASVGLSASMAVLGALRGFGGRVGAVLSEQRWIEKSLLAIEANVFPDEPPRLDREWLARVLANTAVALVLACLAFRRREVPYGAE